MRIRAAGIFLGAVALWGCSTGIESTKPIELSREDKRAVLPTDEELFASSESVLTPFPEWKAGDRFFVVLPGAVSVVTLERGVLPESLPAELVYAGSTTSKAPDGSEEVTLQFTGSDGRGYEYRSRRTPGQMATFTADDFMVAIEEQSVRRYASKMAGKTFWLKSRYRYGSDANLRHGRKFEPVLVDSLTPASGSAAVNVWWTESDGSAAYLPMSLTSKPTDYRRFSNLFFVSDPRGNFPKITDEMWERICATQVALGMTKEECRLALGLPEEVQSGHDYQRTIDIWKYSDGKVLRFEDGLLVRTM